MTETQRKFLTEYLGECWLVNEPETVEFEDGSPISRYNRTFTELSDKQDLLERVIKKCEWDNWLDYLWDKTPVRSFSQWLIQLSPEKTAELICKWKGVE